MGTGKTSVGKRLAERLAMTFLDMDALIEQRERRPISRIFTEDGEPFFRALERKAVHELSARTGLVVATGGGIVLNADNIVDFSRTGLVVCLAATPETILRRVEHETHRPLLAGGDRLQKIRDLLARRQPLYDAIPDRVETDSLTVEQAVEAIVQLYESPRP